MLSCLYAERREWMAFNPAYKVTAHMLQLIEKIAILKTKIESATISVPWIPSLSRDALSRTARSSTAIEGNPLTLKEVQILADGGDVPGIKDRHKHEVLNYLASLRFISDHVDKKIISEKDILRLHRIIGKNALDREPLGEYRPYEVSVGNYQPPLPDDVPSLMADLLEWLNGTGQKLPAIMTSAILHCQFETIHPFGDGNGRVGRVLATWELYRRHFDIHHIFAVDEAYCENRQLYYRALYNVQSKQVDLTGWIEYVCEAIDMTLEQAWKRIQLVQAGKTGEEKIILTPKQEALLKLLRNEPVGIKEIQNHLKTTKPGAHFVLKPLIKHNIVTRIGGYKTGKYTLV